MQALRLFWYCHLTVKWLELSGPGADYHNLLSLAVYTQGQLWYKRSLSLPWWRQIQKPEGDPLLLPLDAALELRLSSLVFAWADIVALPVPGYLPHWPIPRPWTWLTTFLTSLTLTYLAVWAAVVGPACFVLRSLLPFTFRAAWPHRQMRASWKVTSLFNNSSYWTTPHLTKQTLVLCREHYTWTWTTDALSLWIKQTIYRVMLEEAWTANWGDIIFLCLHSSGEAETEILSSFGLPVQVGCGKTGVSIIVQDCQA